jgi:hypothetical protein
MATEGIEQAERSSGHEIVAEDIRRQPREHHPYH